MCLDYVYLICTCGVLNVGYLRHANLLPFGNFSSQIIYAYQQSFYNKQNLPLQSHTNVESLVDYLYLLNDVLFDNFSFGKNGSSK